MKPVHLSRGATDWLVGISMLFFILTHVLTVGFLSHAAERNGVDLGTAAKVIEAGAASRWFYAIAQSRAILTFVILPGFVLAMYLVVRKWSAPVVREFFALAVFLCGFLNVLNDAAIYLGALL